VRPCERPFRAWCEKCDVVGDGSLSLSPPGAARCVASSSLGGTNFAMSKASMCRRGSSRALRASNGLWASVVIDELEGSDRGVWLKVGGESGYELAIANSVSESGS